MAKLLLVEDDTAMAGMYQKAFRFEGYEVELAGDGLEGMEKLEGDLPDLILLDLMMPKMNGREFLEEVKSKERTRGIPVVVLTNLAGENDARLVLAEGAAKYIVKSEHDPKEVVGIVKQILAGHK